MIRSLSRLVLAGALGCALATAHTLAQPPADAPKGEPGKPAAAPAGAQPGGAPGMPAEPEPPKGIPVPSDLPVVKTQTLEDGLLVEDLKIGDGYEIKPGDAVVAHYHGTLKATGKVFDSSFERGEPASFPLSGVIPGWQKGVPGMKVGGIRRLTIPAKLAYGEQAQGDVIPANSDLVFIIQLVNALQIEDLKAGDGEEVGPRPVYVTAYTMKDADGKEVESATRERPFVWLPGEHMGMEMGVSGMKVGGKRKLTIPKEMTLSGQGRPSTHPSSGPMTVEVELITVRNLIPPTPKH